MADTATTTIDLHRLDLSSGEGTRLEMPVRIAPLELGGQTYKAADGSQEVRLDVSRPSNGFAFRLRFPLRLEGPCMRCLEPAGADLKVDAREVDQQGTEDEELRSPYVVEGELDIGRWARDAAALAVPTRLLCRPDCAGLCAGCGEPLNDVDPSAHDHGTSTDPRWDKLNELK